MSRRAHGFRRRDALHSWTLHFGPNMTPMVDVVMVILVFFMASAAFLGSDWFLKAGVIAESAPGAAGSPAAPPPDFKPDPLTQRVDVRLDLDAQGHTVATALDLVKAPLEKLVERVKAMPPGDSTTRLEMIIRPAAQVPYKDVVKLHEACYAVGIAKVGLGSR